MLKCDHLERDNLTYIAHMRRALFFGGWAVLMACVCCIHAVLPWFFTETFSNSVLRLAHKFQLEEKKRYEKFEDWF